MRWRVNDWSEAGKEVYSNILSQHSHSHSVETTENYLGKWDVPAEI